MSCIHNALVVILLLSLASRSERTGILLAPQRGYSDDRLVTSRGLECARGSSELSHRAREEKKKRQ